MLRFAYQCLMALVVSSVSRCASLGLVIAFAACAPKPAPASHAVAVADPRWATLDRDIPALLAEHKVASVSIARVEHGALVWAAAYGAQSDGVRATPDTLYNIASLSKPLSAEVLVRLASRDRLTLDEPMARYWVDPDIAADPRHAALTPRLALSHRTGFPNWRRETDNVLRFVRPPGTAFGYSGEGFEYVARFAERRTGAHFETLSQDLVLGPSGMKHTSYTFQPWFTGHVAVPHTGDGAPLPPQFARRWTASDLVYSTPTDYARFLISILRNDGVTPALAADRVRIHTDRMPELCPTPKPSCPSAAGIGLSWEVYRFGADTILMHTGKDDGLFTFAYVNMTNQSAIVIFTSSDQGGDIVLPILDRFAVDQPFVNFLRG